MNNSLLVCCDLHNTLVLSNDAWIQAFHEMTNKTYSEIKQLIYHKVSRREMALDYRVPYESVLKRYHELVKPNVMLINVLNQMVLNGVDVVVISSAIKTKVEKDLSKINSLITIDSYYYKENFTKNNDEDWDNLIKRHNVSKVLYIGNDYEEDIIEHPNVCSLITGSFLKELLDSNIINRRKE